MPIRTPGHRVAILSGVLLPLGSISGGRSGAVAQSGSAPRSQRGGQGFKSPQLHQNDAVARGLSRKVLQRLGSGVKIPNRERRDGDMWVPEPAWQPVTGAGGSSTRGVWRAERDGQRWIVKRLEPAETETGDVNRHSWWRREAEVATSGILNDSRGLVASTPISVEENDDGITLWSLEVPTTQIADDVLARAYGRFSSQSAQDPGWFTRHMLRDRIAATEDVGGISPLQESEMIDRSLLRTCGALWSERVAILGALDQFPQVLSHGDALPRNMLCQDGEDVIAVDWGQLGYNTVGADLATLSLYATKGLSELIPPYCEGLRDSGESVNETTVRRATVQIAALIAISRASRAVAAGADVDGYLGRLVHAEPILNEAFNNLDGPETGEFVTAVSHG